ncbi:hypothetical protein F5Y10DRAFT_271979 [Nemania abortiva]|nr:hypothetical protein F5Y10DRAFT_271979 [Nemania abortiva]
MQPQLILLAFVAATTAMHLPNIESKAYQRTQKLLLDHFLRWLLLRRSPMRVFYSFARCLKNARLETLLRMNLTDVCTRIHSAAPNSVLLMLGGVMNAPFTPRQGNGHRFEQYWRKPKSVRMFLWRDALQQLANRGIADQWTSMSRFVTQVQPDKRL